MPQNSKKCKVIKNYITSNVMLLYAVPVKEDISATTYFRN
jgi:hypothetical protein